MNCLCPSPDRKYAVLGMVIICQVKQGPEEEIYQVAKEFNSAANISAKDAIHLACAVHVDADFFLTCDDHLRKQAQKLNLQIEIMNPVDYIRREVS